MATNKFYKLYSVAFGNISIDECNWELTESDYKII